MSQSISEKNNEDQEGTIGRARLLNKFTSASLNPLALQMLEKS